MRRNLLTRQLDVFDFQGLAIGVILASLGILFLKAAGLVTGQAAGLALLLSYVLPLEFGALFFLVGVPFLALAWQRKGSAFTIRTLLVVLGISLCTEGLGRVLSFDQLDRIAAAVLGGVCCGIGLLAVFRHNASAGGMTILALIVEQRTGLRAGWVQLGVDAVIFLCATAVLSPAQVGLSFIAAVIMNLIILWNFDIAQAGTGRPSKSGTSVGSTAG